jgi:aryl-alcohol dehydrogenase-like predicted oxidoreductase
MHPARSMPLRSGEGIAALGHGTRHFAESPARRAEEVASVRLGVGLGITVIDTPEMYSSGAAEPLVGEAISGRRSEATPAQIAPATKAPPSCDGGVPANNASEMA